MNTTGLIRRIQQSFGDKHEIVITKDSIVDWINDGQLEITRETQYRTDTNTTNASTWIGGKSFTDLLLVRRIFYGDNPLALLDAETIDRMGMFDVPAGIPVAYYPDGEKLYLHPTPLASDTTSVTIRYVDTPTELASEVSALDIPTKYHNDLFQFVIAKAHEQNENFRAAEYYLGQFYKGLAQRNYESQSNDDSFSVKQPDILAAGDYDCF